MSYNFLKPDVKALRAVDFKRPSIETSNPVMLMASAAAVLMIVFAFLSWAKYGDGKMSVGVSGITTPWGIIGFLAGACTLAGLLYRQYALAFWCAAVGVVVSAVGMFATPGFELMGVKVDGLLLEKMLAADDMKVSHIGAILSLIASLSAAACAFIGAKATND